MRAKMSTVVFGMEAMRAPARVAAIRAWVWLREKRVTITMENFDWAEELERLRRATNSRRR